MRTFCCRKIGLLYELQVISTAKQRQHMQAGRGCMQEDALCNFYCRMSTTQAAHLGKALPSDTYVCSDCKSIGNHPMSMLCGAQAGKMLMCTGKRRHSGRVDAGLLRPARGRAA